MSLLIKDLSWALFVFGARGAGEPITLVMVKKLWNLSFLGTDTQTISSNCLGQNVAELINLALKKSLRNQANFIFSHNSVTQAHRPLGPKYFKNI